VRSSSLPGLSRSTAPTCGATGTLTGRACARCWHVRRWGAACLCALLADARRRRACTHSWHMSADQWLAHALMSHAQMGGGRPGLPSACPMLGSAASKLGVRPTLPSYSNTGCAT